jgi:hypothetical protein
MRDLSFNPVCIPALCLWLVAATLQASPDRDEEIAHLLDFVASSGCVFVRNGDRHSPQDAVKHIRKKADYFEDDIDSAEQFIELSASKSTMSRKPYTIECPGQPEAASRDWLLQELQNFRQQQALGQESSSVNLSQDSAGDTGT